MLPFSEWTDEQLAAKAGSRDDGIKREIGNREYIAEMKAKNPNFVDVDLTATVFDDQGKPLNSKYYLGLPLCMWTRSQLASTSFKHNQGIVFECKKRETLGTWDDGED